MPTTAEELYVVLKAFKEQDANANGDPNDEIPMLGSVSTWSGSPVPFLMSAFMQYDASGDGRSVQDGKVFFQYTTDAYREGLAFIQRLVTEGLLSPDTWSINNTQYRATMNLDETIVGCYSWTSSTFVGTDSNRVNEFKYVSPLKGADGRQRICYAWEEFDVANRQSYFFPASSDKTEIAFRMVDSIFTREGYLKSHYGMEGRDWCIADDEARSAMGRQEGEYVVNILNEIWAHTNNVIWNFEQGLMDYDMANFWNGDPNYYRYTRYLGIQEMLSLIPSPDEYVGPILFTDEEMDEISEIRASINTYWNEFQALVCLGDKNLESDWDTYMKTLDSMGIQTLLDVTQRAYDRTYSK
jgi:putative aldouronate transport system substrate-binding protein